MIFVTPISGWGPYADRDRSSDWNNRLALHNIHREEELADKLDRESRERSAKERPPLPREERVEALLSQRSRTKYADRNKDCSLRDSEIHTLGEVGKFRVVAMNDLAEFAYNGDRSRAGNDIEILARQGLLTQTTIADPEHNPTFHDADLYRLYHKVSDEIEGRGGKVLRVQLDYEIKQELYSRLARLSVGKRGDADPIRKEVAGHFHLKVVSGRIPIPDLRIEYVNENDYEIQRRDLELATEHYRPRGLSEKACAGFELYARRGETDRLRRIRDDRELTAAIFSL